MGVHQGFENRSVGPVAILCMMMAMATAFNVPRIRYGNREQESQFFVPKMPEQPQECETAHIR